MKRIGTAVVLSGFLATSCGPPADAPEATDPDSADATPGAEMPAPAGPAVALVGATWRLIVVSDSAVAAGDNTPVLEFADDSRVTGNTGCNSAGGPYEIDGTSLTIGPLATTRMACLDDTVMWIEANYLRAVDAARSYRLEGDTLVLLDEAEAELARFVR